MWSDIFTHDFPNGEKIAILLLDTQGLFDDHSTLHDNTAIFALSMMLSSVQCYNLVNMIRDNDLQHLDLFTEYGRLALEQTDEKPFQKLLFTVRDWSNPQKFSFGDSKMYADKVFAENSEQTPEMKELRRRIRMSYQQVDTFLLPHPGFVVAVDQNFNGELDLIEPIFIEYVKELSTSLFAPENLIVKKINGQQVRARNLSQYLESYTNMFNSDKLPEINSVLMATAQVSNTILYNDCMQRYSDAMETALENANPFMSENELVQLHEQTKTGVLAQFLEKPKLGGDELRTKFQRKLENGTQQRYRTFKAENERKRRDFIEKANLHNEKISGEIVGAVKRNLLQEIEKINSELSFAQLNNVFQSETDAALRDFATRKMGDDDISRDLRERLKNGLNTLKDTLAKTLESYTHALQSYSDTMHRSLGEVQYYSHGDFIGVHQKAKNAAVNQFQSQPGDNELKSVIQRKIEANIEKRQHSFGEVNEAKRQKFQQRAKAHTEALVRELKASFENKVKNGIGSRFLSGDDLVRLISKTKQSVLQEFESRKLGNDELSNAAYHHNRPILEREIDSLQVNLNKDNERNRPEPYEPSNWVKFRDATFGKWFG
ncbi:atlastin-like [Contarinia nasturtii]|uniref:atlastin-like n=1 Tax=Contarinia nasturtii TaxID=265458 RepID=UPI0012D45554|nr:atlastin-like [Contarinia nasturtii]